MITQLPLIVSLLLFISHAAEIEQKIEHGRCKEDTGCYVRKDCIVGNDASTDAKQLELFTGESGEDLKDPSGCEVFVQIKAISTKKYLFLMEIKKPTVDLTNDHGKGISIMQNSVQQVACDMSNDNPTSENDNWSLKYIGTNPRVFEANRMFCSFIVTATDETIESGFDKAPLKQMKPSLAYTEGGQQIILNYNSAGKALWDTKNMNMKCDLDDLSSSDASFNEYAVNEVDLSRYPIVCPGGKGKLIVQYEGKEFEADELKCISKKLKWFGTSPGIVESGSSVKIGCLDKKYCASCEELPLVKDCTDCKVPDKVEKDEDPNDCKMRKCADGKWTVDGKATIETSSDNNKPQVTCKKDPSGSSKWFMHVKNQATPTLIDSGASCLSVVECPLPSDLSCPEGKKCSEKKPERSSDNKIICSDGNLGNNGEVVKGEVTCNKAYGNWSGVDITKPVYCEEAKKDENPTSEPQKGGINPGMVVGILGGIVVIGALIGGAIYYFKVMKRKKEKGGAGKATTSRKAGQKSSKKSSEKSKSKSMSGGKKSEGSDPPENKVDGAKSTGDSTPATPSTPGAVDGEKKGPPTTDIEGLKTDKDPAAASDPKAPATPGAPPPPPPSVPPPVPPPAGAVPV